VANISELTASGNTTTISSTNLDITSITTFSNDVINTNSFSN
jgi:hypothetical protein